MRKLGVIASSGSARPSRAFAAVLGEGGRFDSDCPEFARGFEAGIQWGTMRVADFVTRRTAAAGVPVIVDEFSELVHPSNIEMVMRMGEALGWQAYADDMGDDLLRVTFLRPMPQEAF